MAKRERAAGWSVLILREPGRPAKQIQVSKRWIVTLPALALLLVAGCFCWREMKSQQRIHELESRLMTESTRLGNTVAGQNGEIYALQMELSKAVRHGDELQSRLDAMRPLETELRRFLAQQDGEDKRPSGFLVASLTPVDLPPAHHLTSPETEDAIQGMEELSDMLHRTAQTLEEERQQAEERQAALDAVPSGWPTVSRKLTSYFGYRNDPMDGNTAFHAGIDISGDVGDPVFAAGDGVVEETAYDASRGNYIIISHRNGLKSWYQHLRKINVKTGQRVKRGARIGQLGTTGRSTGPHLHFQITQQGEPVNPLRYLRSVKED